MCRKIVFLLPAIIEESYNAMMMDVVTEMGFTAQTANVSPVSSTASLYPKSCLKRRLSAPVGSKCAPVSNRTLTSRFSFDYDTDSSGVSVGSELSSSDPENASLCFGSQKSVSFADSIGEDLCHVKEFIKDLSELAADEAGLSWSAKAWRWQIFPLEEHEWGLAEDENESGMHEDCDDMDDSGIGIRLDDPDGVLDDDDSIYMSAPSPTRTRLLITDVDEDDDDGFHSTSHEVLHMQSILESATSSGKSRSANTVIVPTFVSPCDLPDFPARLAERGLYLEDASVTDDGQIAGSVRVHCKALAAGALPTVTIRYTLDNWASSREVAAKRHTVHDDNNNTSNECDVSSSDAWSFSLDARGLCCGDDLELVVSCQLSDADSGAVVRRLDDDNKGLKYRFICKNTPKFKPGKSLW